MYYLSLIVGLLLFTIGDDYSLKSHCDLELSSLDRYIDTKTYLRTPINKFVPRRIIGRQQKMPYNIFQTNQYDVIPWKAQFAVGTIIQKNPEFNYRYYNGTDRRNFIAQHMGDVVLSAYDKIMPNAYKADLFRLCILYVYGGCYIDFAEVNVDSLVKLLQTDTQFMSTLDMGKGNYALNVGFFCSTAGNQILFQTLNKVIIAIAQESYERDALDITGPRKLATGYKKAVHNYTDITAGNHQNGVLILDRSEGHQCLSAIIQFPNGQPFLLSRYPDYHQDMVIHIGKPHYAFIYGQRKVYDKEIKINIPRNFTVPSYSEVKQRIINEGVPVQFTNYFLSRQQMLGK